MQLKKFKITSHTGHFGKFLGYDDRFTYPVPPPSTIIGILQTLYNRQIDNFKFGYLFKSDLIFKDDMTIIARSRDGNVTKKIHAPYFIEYHFNCELIIYTDLDEELLMKYILCMGRAGNVARLHLPIQEVELLDKKWQGFNQFTNMDIGEGRIEPMNLKSEFNTQLDSYDHQVGKLRFNKVFNYDKFYDEEEKQNIYMWQMKNGKVSVYND